MTVLPPNFQEEMMNCELEFQSEINETNIRKLIYVYTLGMQYYNLKEKNDFENYYKNKLNKLLLDENVIKYLDTHKVDLSKKVDLNIFPKESLNETTPKKETNKLTINRRESRDDSDLKKRYSLDMFKKKNKFKKEEIIEFVRKKIKEVDIKLKRIDKQVSDNIVDQMGEAISTAEKTVKDYNIYNVMNNNDQTKSFTLQRKLTDTKKKWKKLKEKIKILKKGNNSNSVNDMEKIDNSESIRVNTINKLQQASRSTKEMENMAGNILGDLNNQSNQMKGVSSKIGLINNDIDSSNSILNKMFSRQSRDKKVIIILGVILVFTFLSTLSYKIITKFR